MATAWDELNGRLFDVMNLQRFEILVMAAEPNRLHLRAEDFASLARPRQAINRPDDCTPQSSMPKRRSGSAKTMLLDMWIGRYTPA